MTKKVKAVEEEKREVVVDMKDVGKGDKELENLVQKVEEGMKPPTTAAPGKKEKKVAPDPVPEEEAKKLREDRKHQLENTDTILTVKDLAGQLHTDGKKLRRYLRDTFGKAEGRWEWAANDPQVKKILEGFPKAAK